MNCLKNRQVRILDAIRNPNYLVLILNDPPGLEMTFQILDTKISGFQITPNFGCPSYKFCSLYYLFNLKCFFMLNTRKFYSNHLNAGQYGCLVFKW